MKENYKDLIKSFQKEDYKNKINLHIHTQCSDGKGNALDFISQAKKMGMNHIAFADHNTLNSYLQRPEILSDGFVIPAIEFDCWFGYVFLHMLGYGFDVNNKKLQELCAKSKRETEADWIRIFSGRHPKEVIAAIHDAGGIAVLAHPACCLNFSLDTLVKNLIKLGLDGIEVFYPYSRHRKYTKFHTLKHIEEVADKFNLIKTGGTDEHSPVLKANKYFEK